MSLSATTTATTRRSASLLAVVLLLLVHAPAQAQGTSFSYTYDPTGQLTAAIDSTGTRIRYVYDPAGNPLAIERTEGFDVSLNIFSFAPKQGGIGTRLTLQGIGFAAAPGDNQVSFNAEAAVVESVGAGGTSLVVFVPATASTGPITLVVGANTAVSEDVFEVLPLPVIDALDPSYAFPGETVDVQVTGANLVGAVWSFEPRVVPALSANALSSSSNSVTVQVIVPDDAGVVAQHTFALVADNAAGSSSLFSSANNTLSILDPAADEDGDGLLNGDERLAGTNLRYYDSDGDGFNDGDEVRDGSDPRDDNSWPLAPRDFAIAAVFSVYNDAPPAPDLAIAPVFSVYNDAPPAPDLAVAAVVSVYNDAPPAPDLAVGPTFSVENQFAP